MSISRRRFLRVGTVAAVVAAVPLKFALVAAGQGIRKDLDGNPDDRLPTDLTADQLSYYTRSAFSSCLNSIFLLQAGVLGTVEVTLSEVRDAMPWGVPVLPGQECFSLIFRNGSGPALRQDTYSIEHAALGSFALFLIPGGADQNGRQSYVAEVNRLANSPALIVTPVRAAKLANTQR